MAAAFTVCAALKFQNAELDEDIALIVGRCVGDEIDRQIEAIDRVIGRLRALEGEKPRDNHQSGSAVRARHRASTNFTITGIFSKC